MKVEYYCELGWIATIKLRLRRTLVRSVILLDLLWMSLYSSAIIIHFIDEIASADSIL